MKIIFILEDAPTGVAMQCLRTELGETGDTPANQLAIKLEQALEDHATTVKRLNDQARADARCLH